VDILMVIKGGKDKEDYKEVGLGRAGAGLGGQEALLVAVVHGAAEKVQD
jgi:hypothetical protein